MKAKADLAPVVVRLAIHDYAERERNLLNETTAHAFEKSQDAGGQEDGAQKAI